MRCSRIDLRWLPLTGLLWLACDSATSPVAPAGTILVLDAAPKTIGVTGSSTITVTVLHPSGVPAREGTEILLTTTLGTIETSPVVTDSRGVARTTLRADGRAGTAEVRATSGVTSAGGAANSTKVDVTIGPAGSDLLARFAPVTNDSLTVFFDEDSPGNPTNWHWTFGDGTESAQREPTHTYARAGSYLVTLTVRDADGQDSATQTVVVPKSEETRPDAKFTTALVGFTATFTDMSEHNPTRWQWSFGDGDGSTAQHPVHVYRDDGSYTVTLTVANAAGEDSTSASVVAPESAVPMADFEPREVEARRVLFRDKSTNDPTSWEWSFGDGTGSTLQNPEHTYAAAGTYTVTLTAANLAGRSSSTQFVEVVGLDADFASEPEGLTVIFTDRSAGRPETHRWNFGDDEISSEQNPTHVYQQPGTYSVTLTVTKTIEGEVETSTISKFVTVTAP